MANMLGIEDSDLATLKAAFLGNRGNILYDGVLTRDEIIRIVNMLKKYSKEELIKKAIDLFNKVEEGKIDSFQRLEKVEAFLVLLLKQIPVEKNEADEYWKSVLEWKQEPNKKCDNKKLVIEVAAMHPLFEGKPNIEFSDRLLKSIEIYNLEKNKGNHPIIYVPGSKHSIQKNGELVEDDSSLSKAGKDFLIKRGIPEKDILADEANQEYKHMDGVYNSGDECYVTTQIANTNNCSRIISVVSPVQIYRKSLFYQVFGYDPEIYAVPTENTAHNYIGEIFWSLFITYMKDYDWQTDFLSYLTRKERNKSYYPGEIEEVKQDIDEILANGFKFPSEVLECKKIMTQKYAMAVENMKKVADNNDLLVDLVRVNGKESEEIQRILELLIKNPNSNITICVDGNENIKDIEELIEQKNLEQLQIKKTYSINDISSEFSTGKCKKMYGLYPSGISMIRAFDFILEGIVPIVSTLPSSKDDYISNISKLLDIITNPSKLLDIIKGIERTNNKKGTNNIEDSSGR